MTKNTDLSKARARAKRMARAGGMTHQQALDTIAREAGHAHWAAMTIAANSAIDNALRQRIERYVDGYEWRGDCGDVTPTDAERIVIAKAIGEFLVGNTPDPTMISAHLDKVMPTTSAENAALRLRALTEDAINGFLAEEEDAPKRGPMHLMPFEIDDFAYLPPPGVAANTANGQVPSLGAMEHDVTRIMERGAADETTTQVGTTISDRIATRMRTAAKRGHARALADGIPPEITHLDLNTQNIAYAMDPEGGPYDEIQRKLVRCPLHADGERCLTILGVHMRCRRGCSEEQLTDTLITRLAAAATKARAFMKANDSSPVVEGWSNTQDGMGGGMGGSHRLENGKIHRMDTLAYRMLGKSYLKWKGIP